MKSHSLEIKMDVEMEMEMVLVLVSLSFTSSAFQVVILMASDDFLKVRVLSVLGKKTFFFDGGGCWRCRAHGA